MQNSEDSSSPSVGLDNLKPEYLSLPASADKDRQRIFDNIKQARSI